MTLEELSVKYQTDKGSLRHRYCDIYDELFAPLKDKPINLLEVGVQFGYSLRMWRDYFPQARIIGLDSIDNNVAVMQGVEIYIVDAYKPGLLLEPQDIIIDDGSHHSYDQEAFVRLYWKFVKPGGYLIVEDILSSGTAAFLGTLLPPSFSYTLYDCTKYAPDGLLFVAQRDWFKPKQHEHRHPQRSSAADQS